MIPWLRNLADMWADGRYIKANDVLRRKLIRAEAAIERLQQTAIADANEVGAKCWQAERALLLATAELDEAAATIKDLRGELMRREGQIERQADLFEEYRDELNSVRRERDAALTRQTELEQTVVAMGAQAVRGVTQAWDDVVAAGLSAPERGQA